MAKKRRILSTFLAASMVTACMAGISVPAGADPAGSTYSIVIPSTLNVANSGWNSIGNISATGTLESGKKLTVTAASTNDWKLVSGTNDVSYTMKSASTDTEATTSWEFTELSSTATTKPIGIDVEDYSAKPAGTYTDTVTFTAKVETAGPAVFTAQLAAKLPYTGGEIADFTDATADLTTMTWAENEHIAILYEVGGTKKVADATITAVDDDDSATIEFTVEAGTPDNTPCTLVYPYSAAKDDYSGVKDAATLLAAQDGTLSANLDVRVGAGTIQTTTPGLTVNTQPEAQFSIFKFTLQDLSAAAKTATEFKVSDGSGNVITTVTPTSASGELYVALPVMAAGTYWFNATIDSKPYIAKATTAAATVAGKYYQTTVKMATIGDVILSDGKFAARSSTGTKVAMIAYLGSETGEAAYNHGLALALSDANSGNTCKWKTSSDDAGHSKQTSSNFTEESGLQYNDATHNSDTYPAFKAAKANNSTAAPTGCSAWFLASGYQWNKMIDAAGSHTALRDGFSGITGASNLKSVGIYWSSTEYNSSKAWYLRFSNGSWSSGMKHTSPYYVRACLAF